MAILPITSLLTGSSTPLLATGDVLAFVDVSDLTQSVNGSTVKATVTQFFAAIPVPIVVTSASANALAVGRVGATNPTLLVDASTASSATGFKVKSFAAGAGLVLSTISSGTNEGLELNAKGSGTITLGGVGTGAIILNQAVQIPVSLSVTGTGLFGPGTGASSTQFQINYNQTLAGLGIASDTVVTATIATFGQIWARVRTSAAAITLTDGYGIQIASASKGAGSTITNLYGLKVEDQSAGGTLNYAIYTGLGQVSLGDTFISRVAANSIAVLGNVTNAAGYNYALGVENGNGLLLSNAGASNATGKVAIITRDSGAGASLSLYRADGTTVGLQMFSTTRTTIGANGAATALTANPVGYLDVVIAGANMQIPYYTRGA